MQNLDKIRIRSENELKTQNIGLKEINNILNEQN